MNFQTVEVPSEAPVMPLPGTLLLPSILLPLLIFEERYRAMLLHALEHDRMFCIALLKPGSEASDSGDAFFSTVGLGLIRACVGMEDGSSKLILQGISRVRIAGWVRQQPFRIARVEPLPSEGGETVEADALAAKVLELCGSLREKGAAIPDPVEKQLKTVSDPSLLADLVSHTFIRDPFVRQQLLEELRVPVRLRHLISLLQARRR